MLKYRADIRTIAGACTATGVYVAYGCYGHCAAWPVRVGGWCALSLLAFQQAVSVHNFCHVKPFRHASANRLFGVWLSVMSGSPASLFVPGHVETHHRAPESAIDALRTNQMAYARPWMNLVLFFPTVLPGVIRNDSRYMAAQRQKRSSVYYHYRTEMVVLHAFMVAQLVVDWRMLLVYVATTTVGKAMIVTLNLLQHEGCDVESKFNGARNFTGPILNYLLFDNGFHQVHHMYPGLHWSLVRSKHEDIKSSIDPDLLHENILWYTWVRFFAPPSFSPPTCK